MSSEHILLLCAALALGSCLASGAVVQEDEPKFIGWDGETYRPETLLVKNNDRGPFDPAKDPWVETLAWAPRSYIYHNFMTDEECKHIIRQAAPQLKRSTVVGSNGSSVEDPIRTSYGMFIKRMHDPIIDRIQKRVATWTHLPPVNQEDMQVLRYGIGQKYGAHYDSHQERNNPGPVGRLATVLLYLNDCEEGGETAFPNTQWPNPETEKLKGPFSECAKGHVAAKPKRGDALLFYTLTPAITQDPYSMHTGCPVVKGFKWTATIWIHTDPFRPETYHPPTASEMPGDPGACDDRNPTCADWAAKGECEKNPGYMVGSAFTVGMCRASCKACEVCGKGDTACISRNRKAGGYLVFEKEEFDSLQVDISSIGGLTPGA